MMALNFLKSKWKKEARERIKENRKLGKEKGIREKELTKI